jgi:outer membrane lipase/esterase
MIDQLVKKKLLPFIAAILVLYGVSQTSYAGITVPSFNPPPPTSFTNINHESIFNAILSACNSSSDFDFVSDCNSAVSDLGQSIPGITPDEILSSNTNITSSAITDSFTRLSTLRQIGGGRPGASADDIVSRLSVYTNGHASWQDYNQQGLNPGFDLFDSKATIGADYRFTDNLIVGLTSSFLNSDTTLKQGAGEIDTNGYGFSIYSSFYLDDHFFIDGTFAYSDQRYRSLRGVNYTGVSQTATAKLDSDTYSAGVITGYNFFVGGWTITPTARWMYRSIQMDGYTESLSNPGGAGGTLALAIGEQEYESITGNFGTQVSYAWSQPWGVVIPTVSAEYVHEFSNNPTAITAQFVNAPTGTGTFTMRNSQMDRDYAAISAGLSAQFMRGLSAFVNYEKLIDLNNLTSDSVSMGIRLELD